MQIKDAWELLGIAPTSNAEAVTAALLQKRSIFLRQNDIEGIRDLDTAKELLLELVEGNSEYSVIPTALAQNEDKENLREDPPAWEAADTFEQAEESQGSDPTEKTPSSMDAESESGESDDYEAASPELPSLGKVLNDFLEDQTYFADSSRWQALFMIADNEPPAIQDAFLSALKGWLPNASTVLDEASWQVIAAWLIKSGATKVFFACEKARKELPPMDFSIYTRLPKKIRLNWFELRNRVYLDLNEGNLKNVSDDLAFLKKYDTKDPTVIELNACFQAVNAQVNSVPQATVEVAVQAVPVGTAVGDFLRKYVEAVYFDSYQWPGTIPPRSIKGRLEMIGTSRPIEIPTQVYYFCQAAMSGEETIASGWAVLVTPALKRKLPPKKKRDIDPYPEKKDTDARPKKKDIDPSPKKKSTDARPKKKDINPSPKKKDTDARPKKKDGDPLPKKKYYDPHPRAEDKNASLGVSLFWMVMAILFIFFSGKSFLGSNSSESERTSRTSYSSIDMEDSSSMRQSLAEELVGREDIGALLLLKFYWRDHPKVDGADNYKAHFSKTALDQINQAKVDSFPKLSLEETETLFYGEGTDEKYGRYVFYQGDEIDKALFVITLNEEGQGTAIYGEGWRPISQDDQERLLEFAE